MRDLHELDRYRLDTMMSHGHPGDHGCGMFELPSPIDGQSLRVIASDGDWWDHVSVSRLSRVPNWIEMEFIKRRFFKDDEVAMQLHVPLSEHINFHPRTLHLWRPQLVSIPRPSSWMIGPQGNKHARR